jgi:hypothetical protein
MGHTVVYQQNIYNDICLKSAIDSTGDSGLRKPFIAYLMHVSPQTLSRAKR